MAPTTPGGPGEGGETEKETPLFEDLKEVVPGHAEYDHARRWEMHQHWIALIGNLNGIQNNIKRLEKQYKELQSEKVFNKPAMRRQYAETLRQKYAELDQITSTLTTVDPATRNRIRREAREVQEAHRGSAIRDTQTVIRALLAERRDTLQRTGGVMRENLVGRLAHLRGQWQNNPPNGYANVRDAWIAYTQDLEQKLNAQDFAALDNGEIDFPTGNQLYKDAEKWWDVVNQLEDSYEDFVRYGTGRTVSTETGEFVDLTDSALEGQFQELKTQVEAEMNPAVLRKFNENVDLMLKKAEKIKAQLEKRLLYNSGDDEKFLMDSLSTLDKKVEELKSNRNIEKMINDAFYGKKQIAEFQAPTSSGKIPVPEGIEGQLQFLRTAPMTNEARRAAARSLSEGMKEMAKKIISYKDFSEVQLIETIENMRLFEEGIDINKGEVTREIIFVNPIETMSQFWHTVTETVKGNVETQAGRGAGYFTKDATKILAKIPNPTNNQMIKSLTELSPNGAQHAEHKEHGRVSDIEKGYEAFNTEHLMHLAAETIDRFEFKACINLLAKRGRVDFYAPWLFKQLNRWQNTVKIPLDPYWHQKNLTRSEELMRQAYIYIYRDSEAFKSMKNQNASAYESKMGEYKKNWGGIAAEAGALENEAERILKQYEDDHAAGKHFSSADPIKFESIIRYAIDDGKMRAEARLRLMVRGIASGLLPFDRGVGSTDKNNTYPPLDWFDSNTERGQKPTIDDVKEMDGYAKDVQTWNYYMHKKIMYNEAVYQRLDKTLTQGSHRVDHDDAMMLAGYITAGTVKDMLTQKTSGGYGMPKTGLMSLATGHEFWLDMYSELYEGRDQATNNLEIVRFASQFLMYEGILNRRTYKTTNMFRLDSDAEKKPRSAGGYSKVFGRSGDQNMNQLLSGVGGYLSMLDFNPDLPLIKKMLNGEIKDDTAVAKICSEIEAKTVCWKGEPPTNLNDLYERIGSYIKFAVEDPNRLSAMVQKIKQDHQGTEAYHKLHHDMHDAEHHAEHVRQNEAIRAETGKEPAHH